MERSVVTAVLAVTYGYRAGGCGQLNITAVYIYGTLTFAAFSEISFASRADGCAAFKTALCINNTAVDGNSTLLIGVAARTDTGAAA